MRSNNSYLCFSVAALATASASPVLAGGEAGKLELRDFGGKFVGYTTQDAANNSVDVLNPMFVQYLLPARQRHKYPVVFIHGGGGQGTDWLGTPDGRDGWADYFVADGWTSMSSTDPVMAVPKAMRAAVMDKWAEPTASSSHASRLRRRAFGRVVNLRRRTPVSSAGLRARRRLLTAETQWRPRRSRHCSTRSAPRSLSHTPPVAAQPFSYPTSTPRTSSASSHSRLQAPLRSRRGSVVRRPRSQVG